MRVPAPAWRPMLLVLPPAAGLAGVLGLPEIHGAGVPTLSGLLLAATLVAVGLGLWCSWHEWRGLRLRHRSAERLATTHHEADRLAAEVRRLRGDVDILAAAREIGLVVNADNEFHEVLDKVTRTVADMVAAREVVLFMRNLDTGAIRAVARRCGAEFSTRLATVDVDRVGVPEAFESRRLRVRSDTPADAPPELVLTLPLVVDGQTVGVLRAFVEVHEHRATEQRTICERALHGIERHLALAIKAPTLYDRAVRDVLTGLYSRRHLDNQLAECVAITRRTGKPVSVIITDVDHFKKVNDNHGHQAGDYVLREVGAILRQAIRGYDTAYRYGGEELVVLMPDTDTASAARTAERIRRAIAKHDFTPPEGERIPVTASFGVATFAPQMAGPADLVAAADRALYRAKEGGRNQVVTAERAPLAASA